MFRRVRATVATGPPLLGPFGGALRDCRRFAPSVTFAEAMEACSVLGVGLDISEKDLKRKYRDLVRQHHPDAGGNEATMSRITVAYDRLSSLSKYEKEQFTAQKSTYRASSHFRSGGNPVYGQGNPRWNPNNVYGDRSTSAAGGASGTGFYNQQADAETRAYASANSRVHYNYRKGTAFGENPFSTRNPFSMNSQLRRAMGVPAASLLIRGIVLYLVCSAFALFLYRCYLDWKHDDGWKMSESLARHEKMEELHRIRREMSQRIENARAEQRLAYQQQQWDMEHAREQRALDYAVQQQKRLQGNFEFLGWPPIREEKGQIVHRAHDPWGVAYFEPRREDARVRQVQNMKRGRQSGEDGSADASGPREVSTALDLPTREEAHTRTQQQQESSPPPQQPHDELNEAIRSILEPIARQVAQSK